MLNTRNAHSFVTSKDGTSLHYQTVGMGPSLIIVPGALSLAADYKLLAQALADTFTVHILERRGRGLSGEMGANYSILKEVEDVSALQHATHAQYLFGHSYGGLIAIEAARNNPTLQKIAIYEPGVSINKSISIAWMAAYQAHLAAGNTLDAFVDFIRATGPAFMKVLPNWWLKFVIPKVIKGEEWTKKEMLLSANLREHQQVAHLDNTYLNYRQVSAAVLLMCGGKSPGFREKTLRTLSSVLPASHISVLPKQDHFAPTDGAPVVVANAIKAYFC